MYMFYEEKDRHATSFTNRISTQQVLGTAISTQQVP